MTRAEDEVQRLRAELKEAREAVAAERDARKADCSVCGGRFAVGKTGIIRGHVALGQVFGPPDWNCPGGAKKVEGWG